MVSTCFPFLCHKEAFLTPHHRHNDHDHTCMYCVHTDMQSFATTNWKLRQTITQPLIYHWLFQHRYQCWASMQQSQTKIIPNCLKNKVSRQTTKNEGILKSKTYYNQNKAENLGTSLVVQYLRLHAPNAGGLGLIPGQGTRCCMLQLEIPHATTKIENSTWPNT